MSDAARRCPTCEAEVPAGAVSCPSCGAISDPSSGDSATADDLAQRLAPWFAGRYQIIEPLGRGGMATVFRALDVRHHREVAIKVLRPELAPVLGPDRFLREIEIAARLNHPHIVPLYDSGEADGLLYYVMPCVEGASLRHRLASAGALPVADAVRIAHEVADALAYAHERDVVHRDIKPENILLTRQHAMVADFGVARALHATWHTGPTTTAGLTLGTPYYMSPEQADASTPVDGRTDVYALGCTLYEMLTGRPPYTGQGAVSILAQHLAEPPPRPGALRAHVPPALDALVVRAMAKRRDDRHATAAELAAALEAVDVVTATSSATRWRPLPTRWMAALAALGIVAAALAVGRALRTRATDAERTPLRIVVLPFEDRGAQAGVLGDQLAERLTARLVGIPSLHVAAAAAVAGLRGAPLDTLRARFAPDRFVLGALEAPTADRVRVAVQVIDPASGRGLFDSSFVVPRAAPGPDSASARLSVIVRHALWDELERDQRRRRVHDAEAWTLVERARDLAADAEQSAQFRLDQRAFRSFDVADSLYVEAARHDRTSDLIPVERARVAERKAFVAEFFRQFVAPAPPLPVDARAERERALATLDALIRTHHGPADAYELRGRVWLGLYRELRADSRLQAAIRDFRSATELDLHRATAWKELAAAQRESGRFAESLLSVDRAFLEDDFALYRVELLRSRFDAALHAGRFAVADTACRAWRAEAPRAQLIFDCTLLLWSRTRGDADAAVAARARADSMRTAGDSVGVAALLRQLYVAEVLARAGHGADADAMARAVEARAGAALRPRLVLELAYVRLLRGDPDSARALIVEATQAAPTIRRLVDAVPWFAPLRTTRGESASPRTPSSRP